MSFERRRVLFGEPTEITGDQERDALACALRAIEAREGERRGWDQPPRLWSLHLADMTSGAIELRVIPPRVWAGSARNPADGVLAWSMQYPDPGPVTVTRFADSGDGFAGMAMMHEGFSIPDDTEEDAAERQRRAAGERTYLTRPDRVEVRMITAVDVNGRTYLVRRLRGREPEIHASDAGENSMGEMRGRLPHALGRIAHAVRTGALMLS